MIDFQPASTRAFHHRLGALDVDHQRAYTRFERRLARFRGVQLSQDQRNVVLMFLLRLGERWRNPANTGNLEDLFFYTLKDTGDAIQAFAQMLADSYKVVPIPPDLYFWPHLKTLDGQVINNVGGLERSAVDSMVICHTMVAYSDAENYKFMELFMKSTIPPNPRLRGKDLRRQTAQNISRVALWSQHAPSSTYVLARMSGMSLQVENLYLEAGRAPVIARNAQRFYDHCAHFEYSWHNLINVGGAPVGSAWKDWLGQYTALRKNLDSELNYQLTSDTFTNFMSGTMDSGKWVNIIAGREDVTDPSLLPSELANLVNLYLFEYTNLHNRPAYEFIDHYQNLEEWGVAFDVEGRAIAVSPTPEKAARMQQQFEATVNQDVSRY